MKKTFKFTKEQRGELFDSMSPLTKHRMGLVLDRIEQIVSERITPEQGESGQIASVKEFLSNTTAVGVIERKGVGEYSMTFDLDRLASILTTYASQVCADKEADLQDMTAMRESAMRTVKNLADRIEPLQNEIDSLNESMTVMLRKNAELEKELEYAKIR